MNAFQYHLRKYVKHTPSFSYIKRVYFNDNIQMDHVAHRSFDYDMLMRYYGSNQFALRKEQYFFPHINVKAIWLQSPEFRVFLSQYEGLNKFHICSFEDYKHIQKKNDYVAWTLLHRYDINHVAIRVDNIEEIVDKIKKDTNLRLNNELEPIEKSIDGKLLQASTVADTIPYLFPNGETHNVPYAFVEFVERKEGREGFETKNATRIFTSTHF
jgi:hypothetical protein